MTVSSWPAAVSDYGQAACYREWQVLRAGPVRRSGGVVPQAAETGPSAAGEEGSGVLLAGVSGAVALKLGVTGVLWGLKLGVTSV